ncbi:MAG: hypothetical protein Udaeo2_31420 [Candidatus Udaeobacter sp.]|nr:MAG: hypothetical protein Udaeo2_31420 [Candidatus Udaeobacter sp.]
MSDNSHDADIRKSIRLIARVSTLITDGWRISHEEEPLPEKPDLTQAGNFFYKLEGKVPQIGKSECWTRFSIFTPITNLTRPLCSARNRVTLGNLRGSYLSRRNA